MTPLDKALREVDRAHRRLAVTSTPLTRKNARKAFLRALRRAERAMLKEYPKIAPPPDPSPRYALEWFQPRHREGRRLLNDRWVRVTKGDPCAHRYKLATRTMKLSAMAALAVRAQRFFDDKVFRLREVGTDNTILVAMLAGKME